MANIAVVTDSVGCLPQDLAEQYNIKVAPVHIIWDKVPYRDGIDLSITDFYRRLRTSKTLPTTSSAIQGEFLTIFEELQGKVDGIVTVVLTGELGAAYNSACSAREMVPGVPIEVIDTHNAMMAQGFIVLEAAKVAAAGKSMEEVADAARKAIPSAKVFWAMDTLEYLRRGGRVSVPKALIAGWLKVKPIMTIVDGRVDPIGRVRTRPKAIERLLELASANIKGSGPLHMAVLHGDVPEEAEKLKQMVTERFSCTELVTSQITPVIGTHLGPGALGIAVYEE